MLEGRHWSLGLRLWWIDALIGTVSRFWHIGLNGVCINVLVTVVMGFSAVSVEQMSTMRWLLITISLEDVSLRNIFAPCSETSFSESVDTSNAYPISSK